MERKRPMTERERMRRRAQIRRKKKKILIRKIKRMFYSAVFLFLLVVGVWLLFANFIAKPKKVINITNIPTHSILRFIRCLLIRLCLSRRIRFLRSRCTRNSRSSSLPSKYDSIVILSPKNSP